MYRIIKLPVLLAIFAITLFMPTSLRAQDPKPLTSNEIVRLVYQLPRDPDKRDEIVEEIRKRGIGFPLTDGIRSLVATKSGNDAILRRTLEEAERRRVNPVASSLPPETEANELLARTRNVTLAAANAMPDFLVKQLIRRSVAYGKTENWIPQDNLTIAVGYRANVGEQYRVLTINGMPVSNEGQDTQNYGKLVGGATTSGVEYISALADIFKPESQTEFRVLDTDVIQERRTIVFEYKVKRERSLLSLGMNDSDRRAVVGSRGRIWVDRELDRVLRFEQISTEIPPDFPITATNSVIDYDWVTINERKYLLPIHSEILMTSRQPQFILQSRNNVRFRSYQKFGAELKVIDEIGEDDEPADTPPVMKPRKP